MKAVGIRGGLNRRELLLLAGASACPTILLPRSAGALIIPPPPPSLRYLLFIADGIYRISGLYIIDLPASYGTARTYNEIAVAAAVRGTFTFAGPHGISPWNMLINAPSYEWFEVMDRRNGRILNLWKYDRFEVRFSDKSRVKVVFRTPGTSPPFWPLEGSERLPDGTLLYPPDRRGTLGGDGKGRDGDNDVTPVKPSTTTFSWSYSTQETPW